MPFLGHVILHRIFWLLIRIGINFFFSFYRQSMHVSRLQGRKNVL